MNIRGGRLATAALVTALAVIGCDDEGDDPDPSAAASTTAAGAAGADGVESAELAGGDVFVTGSSTVEPISVLVSELAAERTDGALAVTVEGPGTGDGFAKFCEGEADIADASRRIKDEEAATCAQHGVEFVGLEVAIDGVTVATNPRNATVDCLDVPALYALVGPESEGIDNWSDAVELAAELGSTVALPDADLLITGPGAESGTYDAFVEFAIADIAAERGVEPTTRVDYTASANDNVIVEGIEATSTSLGWLGYAFYSAEQDRMRALAIDAGNGCVVPTAETIGDGTYPFSRTLYIYVNTARAADNGAVASYVDVYLSAEGIAQVSLAGYVPVPPGRQAAALAAWEASR